MSWDVRSCDTGHVRRQSPAGEKQSGPNWVTALQVEPEAGTEGFRAADPQPHAGGGDGSFRDGMPQDLGPKAEPHPYPTEQMREVKALPKLRSDGG